MASDLGRCLFAAVFAAVCGHSPKAADFPLVLSSDHRNWRSGATEQEAPPFGVQWIVAERSRHEPEAASIAAD